LLTQAQKEERVETCRSLIGKFKGMGQNAFLRVVTGDETWVHYFEPKRKQQNMVWIAEGEHPPQMAKRERTRDKVMYAIFFNGEGAIAHPTPPGRTITGNYYRDSVLPYVQNQYNGKYPNEPLRLHHDNAPAHRSGVVMDFMGEQGIELIPHPPYSPDLAPCDFWLFSRLKDHLRGTRYASRSQLGSVIYQYMKHVPVSDYVACYEMWQERLVKCINVGGIF